MRFIGRRRAALGLFILCTAFVHARDEGRFVPGELIVKYAGQAPVVLAEGKALNSIVGYGDASTSLTEVLQKHGFRGVRTRVNPRGLQSKTLYDTGRVHLLQFPENADIQQIATELRGVAALEYAEPNYLGRLAYTPSDPDYAVQQQSDFAQINLETGWGAQGTPGGSASVKIAVIDSGADASHPDLANVIDLPNSYNFADGNTTISDDIGHGTRVSGIIAAQGNNGEGMAGVAFGSKILALDVTNSLGAISASNAASAVNWAVSHGASVINLSIAFSADSQILRDACNAAAAAGVLVIAAAGNENQGNAPVYPAAWPSVLGVGALNDSGVRASYSNYNGAASLVDLFAPGDTIYTTTLGGQYDGVYNSGTSYACAVVSGVAALVKSSNVAQGGAAIRDQLQRTAAALPAGFSPANGGGYGKVNAGAALSTAMTPLFSIHSVIVDDNTTISGTNNADGRLDAGETANLVITLKNNAADTGSFIGTLSTTETLAGVTITTSSWAPLSHDLAGANTTSLRVSLSGIATAGLRYFSLSVSANGGSYVQVLPVTLTGELKEYIAGGTYPGALNWTNNKTYVLQGAVNVQGGLTIQPGTTVLADPTASLDISGGTLSAQGTAAQPIIFSGVSNKFGLTVTDDDLVTVSRSGGTNPCWVWGSTAMPNGATVTVGHLRGTTYFPTRNGTPLVAAVTQFQEAFVACYDADGFAIWAKTIKHDRPFYDSSPANSLAVASDNSGNLYVSGSIVGNTIFGSGEANETSFSVAIAGNGNSNYEPFVAKYNGLTGNLIWARRGVSCSLPSSQRSFGYGITATLDGGAVAVGEFADIISFTGGATSITLTSFGGTDAYVARYDASGALLWAKQAGSSAVFDQARTACALSDGSFLVGGAFLNTCKFGPGETASPGFAGEQDVVPVAPGFTQSLFVAKYAANGQLVWVKSGGSDSNTYPFVKVSAFPNDDFIVAGSFAGSLLLGAFDPTPVTLTSALGRDIYTARFDSTGVLQWAKRAGSASGSNADEAFAVQASNDYTCYIAGRCAGSAIFGPGEPAQTSINRPGDCGFFAKLAPTGALLWVKSVGGNDTFTNPAAFGDECRGIALHSDGTVSIAGFFDNSATFGLGETRQTTLIASASYDGGEAGDIFLAKYAGTLGWGGIHITSGSSGGTLEHCNIERGELVNDHAATTIENCTSTASPTTGILSTAGSASIEYCTVSHSRRGALALGARDAANCTIDWSRGVGLHTTGAASNTNAGKCIGDGLIAAGVTSSTALSGLARGIVSAGAVTSSTASGNAGAGIVSTGNVTGSTSQGNTGVGISISGGSATASGCLTQVNKGGGISTSGAAVNGCTVKDNTGIGIAGSGGSIVACTISGNSGAAVSGVTSVLDSVVSGNGGGLNNVGTHTRNYVGNNTGIGVSTGNVTDSTVVGNTSHGIQTNGTVTGSLVVGNSGVGVQSVPGSYLGTVSNSTVTSNTSYGVRNLGLAGIQGSNLFGNGTADAFDDQSRSTTSTKNLENNYWGTSGTLAINAKPFVAGVDLDPYIIDGSDALASLTGWFLDYSPHATTPVTSALSTAAPTCLLNAVPPVAGEFVSRIGVTTFTLTFSRDMDQAVTPAATFGKLTPYTDHVIGAAPGWVNARTWQGTYAIQSAADDGANTLRVSQARDVNGFVIPDDVRFKFTVAAGAGVANNGQVIVVSGVVSVSWSEIGKTDEIVGFHVERSSISGLTGWQRITTGQPVESPPYADTTANVCTHYWYRVFAYTTLGQVVEWTPVLEYIPGTCNVHDWKMY